MVDNPESSQELTFDADRPIESRMHDLLGRGSFAENIARELSTVPVDEGFAAAVVGEWGSGKTSVLNMVQETLEAESANIVVLRFNPWLFGGAHDLLIRFFSELAAQLGQSRRVNVKEVVSAFLDLGTVAAPLTPFPWSFLLSTPLRFFAKLLRRPQSLDDRRKKLKNTLINLDYRIIVIIDDIDRLEAGETRELIRLVRLTSDLPNIVFLLAFDWLQVAKTLEETGQDGSAYLDKIIQIKYDLPMIRKDVLSSVLFASLEGLQEEYEVLPLDRDVWLRVHEDVIRPLLGNLRDVRRFVNSLRVTLDTLGTEVALADLLGLEAIRVMAPEMFETIRTHAGLLVRRNDPFQPSVNEQGRQGAIHRMLSEETDAPFSLKTVLDILFPVALSSNGMLFLGGQETEWRRNRRVACEEVLSIYLLHQLGETALENVQIEDIVAALTDENELKGLLDSLDEDQFEEALERMEGYENDFPIEGISAAVPVLTNRLYELTPRRDSLFAMPSRIKGTRVILRLLRRELDQDRLFANVTELLGRVDSLSGWLELIELVGSNENIGQRLVSDQHARNLEEMLANRLEEATADELGREWTLIRLLVRPARWLAEERSIKLYSRLKEHLNNENFLVSLLRAVIGTPTPNSYAQIASNWEALVEVFGDSLIEAVIRLADSPSSQEFASEDKRICDLAKKYAEGWRPEDDWGSPW